MCAADGPSGRICRSNPKVVRPKAQLSDRGAPVNRSSRLGKPVYRVSRELGEASIDHRITVEKLPFLESRLRSTIGRLKERGVPVPLSGRLEHCADVLRETHAVGSFPSDRDRLSVIAEAILTSRDFARIESALPTDVSGRRAALDSERPLEAASVGRISPTVADCEELTVPGPDGEPELHLDV